MNKVVEPVATATLKEDGGAAFPVNRRDTVRDSLKVVSDGMSLRDYFAAQALNAIVIVTSFGKHIPQREDGKDVEGIMARDAYDLADAMIAHRTTSSSDATRSGS